MKKFAMTLLPLLFLGAGCFGSSDVYLNTTAEETPAAPGDAKTLLRENALLILEAGRVGIEAETKAEWILEAAAVSQLLAEGKESEAAAKLFALNAEIRAAILAARGE